jgi:hypothetical protein
LIFDFSGFFLSRPDKLQINFPLLSKQLKCLVYQYKLLKPSLQKGHTRTISHPPVSEHFSLWICQIKMSESKFKMPILFITTYNGISIKTTC